MRLGAAGVQVGTAFAFCEESGIQAETKRQAIALSRLGQARVFTDPVASPTGFPFKVAQIPNTLSDAAKYDARPARLRPRLPPPSLSPSGRHHRLPVPGRTVRHYGRKGAGGAAEETLGRKCGTSSALPPAWAWRIAPRRR